MSGRESAIWAGAIALSLLVHGLLWLKPADMPLGDERLVNAERTTTRVTFRAQAAPPDIPQPVQPPRPAEPPAEVEEPPKPKPKTKPKPETVKPQPKPVSEAAKQPASETVVKQAVASAESAPQPVEQPMTGVIAEQALSPAAREAYLHRLLEHIEANKQYPKAARRRRIEGIVQVSFELMADGSCRGLQVSGGHSLLEGAAEAAVNDSVPMPVPPRGMKTPLPVQFEMVFTLK